MADKAKELENKREVVIKKQDKLAEEQAELQKEREDLTDQIDDINVSNMDASLVEDAKKLGVNPRNFSNDEQLKEAIKISKSKEN